MSVLGLREASQAVGVTRQHLYRLAGKGRLSLVQRPDGSKGVDTSELLRAFGRLNTPPEGDATGDTRHGSQMRREATSSATAVQTVLLEAELAAAKAALQVAEERLAEAKERESKLLELLVSQTRLLEHHQAPQPTAHQAAPVHQAEPAAPIPVETKKPKKGERTKKADRKKAGTMKRKA